MMILILQLILVISLFFSPGGPEQGSSLHFPASDIHCLAFGGTDTVINTRLNDFLDAILNRETEASGSLYNYFDSLIVTGAIADSLLLSNIHYFCGLYSITVKADYAASFISYKRSADIRKAINITDRRFTNALSNQGVSLFRIGRYEDAAGIIDSVIQLVAFEQGANAPDNIGNYSSLASSFIQLNRYDEAISAAQSGLDIAGYHNYMTDSLDVIRLYNNLSISYSRQNDYVRALIYLRRGYDMIVTNPGQDMSLFVNIINSLTVISSRLGDRETARDYFVTAYPVAMNNPGESAFYLMSNYAFFLAEQGDLAEAESIMSVAMDKVTSIFSRDTRFYYEMIEKYASLLSSYEIDVNKALLFLEEQAIPYCQSEMDDYALAKDVYHTYARALAKTGRYAEALHAVQRALFANVDIIEFPLFANPDAEGFSPDRTGLGLMSDKVTILRSRFNLTGDTVYLAKAIESNRMLISYIEQVRIDLSEEESRILLGDNYRKVYDGILADLYHMLQMSGDDTWFDLAFEYAERSKAAGLLVSLREIKATQFMIPDSLADIERDTENRLGAVREQLYFERSHAVPDKNIINSLLEEEYNLTERKAHITSYFEDEYPGYFDAKYNTSVATVNDLLQRTKANSTYINYVFTDTVLYTFAVNRKRRDIVAIQIDSALIASIEEFRNIIFKPPPKTDLHQLFERYCYYGNYLYERLILPVRDIITTDRLIISPDNILTYIPFETLLTSYQLRDDMLYRELDYLLKEFSITYTYSATMFVETYRQKRSSKNNVLAFAPEYIQSIKRDSVLNSRQMRQDILYDLPYAREEAAYAVEKLGGELYLKERATESVYKKRAAHFPVIHLAMHTIINDLSPGYSRLIFSAGEDEDQDGYLNTYEIYGVPINARMVVVSSCNTGSGQLRTGEGVMSLARGFINAGAKSVAMSLWEVDDKWGTVVIKSFYDNLKMGMSKSLSLKNAKLDYISESRQHFSHPYYWSTLVIYGNDGALFIGRNRWLVIIALSISLAAALIGVASIIYSK